MKKVALFQLVIMLLGAISIYLAGMRYEAASFLSGALIVAGNFILLGLGWGLVFRKKLIALSVLIIVFKYAILGVIIYQIVRQDWLAPVWFAIGVASIMMASLIYGITIGIFKEE